jgi:DnaB-like helicase C terminal domain
MEMGAFTGAVVALLAKDMASAIASEMGKDVSGAAKQALRRLGQRLRREPDTRAAMEQLEANPSDPAVQERLAEQLTGKLTDPAFREDLQGLLDELDRQTAAAAAAEDPVQEIGEGQAGPPDAPAAAARTGTRSVRDELVGYLEDLGQRAPLVFSLDLTGGQVIHRLLCAEGSIDSQRLLLGRLDERDWVRLTRVLGRVADAPLMIDASPTMTVDAIATACRQLRERIGLGLVIIDEVGMIQPLRRWMIRRGNARRWPARSNCWPGSSPCRWLSCPACRSQGGPIAGRCLPISPKGSGKRPAWSCCCIVRSWMICGRRGATRPTRSWPSTRADRPTW